MPWTNTTDALPGSNGKSPISKEDSVRIIEVVVSPKGETTVQTRGYSGADCLQASKWLEQALGIATSDNKTVEFYQPAVAEEQIEQR
jgi:hypothetical protein